MRSAQGIADDLRAIAASGDVGSGEWLIEAADEIEHLVACIDRLNRSVYEQSLIIRGLHADIAALGRVHVSSVTAVVK